MAVLRAFVLSWRVALLFLATFQVTLVAGAEKPPDTYRKSMQDLAVFSKAIDKAIADADFEAVSKYAVSAKEAFGTVEYFWRTRSLAEGEKGNAESAARAGRAANSARAGSNAAADLGVAATLKSTDGIVFAAKAIAGLCGGCHDEHRQTMPDGTFEIK